MFEENKVQMNTNTNQNKQQPNDIEMLIKESWSNIAPFWPLKNLIAVNPLQGLEDLPIEQALIQGAAWFEQQECPEPMQLINRQSIKWLQAFCDQNQATISMPLREEGLYHAWKKLAYYDKQIHGNNSKKQQWLLELPNTSKQAIIECLHKLNIPSDKQSIFMTLMLTTLPGWASYIQYLNNWTQDESIKTFGVNESDYMAFRLILTCLLWEDAEKLVLWYEEALQRESKKINPLHAIEKKEAMYVLPLIKSISSQTTNESTSADAQLVFCIDVRSEPFRRALESRGQYETFGFAGFFGLPVRIKNETTDESYAACPVLLTPQHTVHECPSSSVSCHQDKLGYEKLKGIKAIYQSLKYNFTTSFTLVELLGLVSGIWMALRCIAPNVAARVKKTFVQHVRPQVPFTPSLENMALNEQCTLAESALRGMGLISDFSPLVVFCGHGSTTENNAYATALDCGACAGRHGASNAKILAKILNQPQVREHLNSVGIAIPKSTHFIGAEHNTTTDDVELYLDEMDVRDNVEDVDYKKNIEKLSKDLKDAGRIASKQKAQNMGYDADLEKSTQYIQKKSMDWAQVRPEWGLAKNASFIIAPRGMTKNIDLKGRSFLHSYDYRQDVDGSILTVILTAPMVVAQWINNQYLFSTLDNVAYGSGSKITKNITGKFGIMQGNASDLMTGLPLQSVYSTDKEPYHEALRLMSIVYAPTSLIDKVIKEQTVLQKLLGNGWVRMIAIDPSYPNHPCFLKRDLTWSTSLQ